MHRRHATLKDNQGMTVIFSSEECRIKEEKAYKVRDHFPKDWKTLLVIYYLPSMAIYWQGDEGSKKNIILLC